MMAISVCIVNNTQAEKSSINYFSASFQKASPHSTTAQRQAPDTASTSGTSRAQFEQEFTQGSAIDPALYAPSICIVADTEQLPGGEVSAPIHDALNWKLTRFGHQARVTLLAALLLQESGECWQAKLSRPRKNTKGKLQKYETPVGNGSQAFLPAIPDKIRQRIRGRYGVEVPPRGSFWKWLQQHPEIPIIFTEGGKKALALLSLGYVAIALYGVNGGYLRCKVTGDRSLIPDVARFAVAERQITLAFDQDADAKTRSRVNAALTRFGRLLQAASCNVAIAAWDGEQGKGADDLIVNCGVEAFDRAMAEALPLNHWRIWQRLDRRLTYSTSLRVNQADLSTLSPDRLPEQGIIAIAAAKGTGKTKLIAQAVRSSETVLSAGHRIALMRNLCQRLGMSYRGDLDRAQGRFIDGAGYALRIGFCVDALLAIDPDQFKNCDLLIDEVVQVLRHLLTSSTCNKDGMRPLLLTRFAALVRLARRVIVADADLDNATLHYLQQIRGDNAPVFLLRNDHQAAGYNVRFIEATDSSTAIASLLADVGSLQPGKTLFIATDSLRKSKHLHRLVQQQYPDKRFLLLNSETSSGADEQAFTKNPDAELPKYDGIIATPSLGTGASIEAQGKIDRVYGIFSGGSSTDADMAQALGRVREPVDRVVWCAKRGTNFSKVSRSSNRIELKRHLQQQTSVAASLVKLSLTDTTQGAIAAYDWAGDEHLKLWSHFTAEQNRSMLNLRDALLVRLRHEGHHVSIEAAASNDAMKLLLKTAREELRQIDAEAIANADELTFAEITLLQAQESLTQEERLIISNFHLRDFYVLEALTTEDVLGDKDGRYRGELLNLEAMLFPGTAIERTARALEKQASWNQGLCPWDISGAAVRGAMREKVGLAKYLNPNREWTKYDLAADAETARRYAAEIKMVLHFTITPGMSDVQIIHQLLSQLGVKVVFRWSRKIAGHEGEKLKVFRLDAERWQQSIDILERRKARRESLPQSQENFGSPLPSTNQKQTGDPNQIAALTVEEWLSEENLVDVRLWLESAAADPTEEVIELLSLVPSEVMKRAIAVQAKE